jgi:hypothetical protein
MYKLWHRAVHGLSPSFSEIRATLKDPIIGRCGLLLQQHGIREIMLLDAYDSKLLFFDRIRETGL